MASSTAIQFYNLAANEAKLTTWKIRPLKQVEIL